MSLADDLKAETADADLRGANRRLLLALDKAKATRAELVEAVYQAAKDAASALVIPLVAKPEPDRRKGKPEVAVVVLSDFQLGKVTPSYNSDICAERIEKMAHKVRSLTAIQRADHPVRDCHVFLLGDVIEGEMIFPGQAHRIDSSLYRQVTVDGPRILATFLRAMLDDFQTVTVWSVDGNHGALGGPFRKEYHPESNGDRMLYRITATVLGGEKRLTWHMPDPAGERNWYVVAEIGRYRSLLLHGDQFRGHSGIPWYGIQKKAGGWALGAIPETFDDVDFGHWHQPTRLTLNRVTARCNGSTESHNTFAIEQLAAVGRPSQGLRFIEPEAGHVTAEYTVYLD